MAALSSSIISTSKFPSHLRVRPKTVLFRPVSAKKDRYGSDFGNGFGLVDESMIVLRRRIRDIEVAEGKYDPPLNWTECEKRYYSTYKSDVYEFVGMVQRMLLRTRPGLAIGLAGLMAMSIPVSAVLIWVHLVETVRLGVFVG